MGREPSLEKVLDHLKKAVKELEKHPLFKMGKEMLNEGLKTLEKKVEEEEKKEES